MFGNTDLTDLLGKSETFARRPPASLPVAPTHHETALVRCPDPHVVNQAGPAGSRVTF